MPTKMLSATTAPIAIPAIAPAESAEDEFCTEDAEAVVEVDVSTDEVGDDVDRVDVDVVGIVLGVVVVKRLASCDAYATVIG